MKAVLTPQGQELTSTSKVSLLKTGGVSIIQSHIYEKPIEAAEDGEQINVAVEQILNSNIEPHPDFIRALDNFKPHFLFLTEFLNEKDYSIKDVEKMMDWPGQKPALPKEIEYLMGHMEIISISLKGEDAKKGIVISGVRIVRVNKKVSISSPRILLEEDILPYKHINLLNRNISALEDEISEYMKGKCAWDGQLSLDFTKTIPMSTGTAGV